MSDLGPKSEIYPLAEQTWTRPRPFRQKGEIFLTILCFLIYLIPLKLLVAITFESAGLKKIKCVLVG